MNAHSATVNQNRKLIKNGTSTNLRRFRRARGRIFKNRTPPIRKMGDCGRKSVGRTINLVRGFSRGARFQLKKFPPTPFSLSRFVLEVSHGGNSEKSNFDKSAAINMAECIFRSKGKSVFSQYFFCKIDLFKFIFDMFIFHRIYIQYGVCSRFKLDRRKCNVQLSIRVQYYVQF